APIKVLVVFVSVEGKKNPIRAAVCPLLLWRPWLSSMPSSWLAGCSTHFHLSWGTRMTTAGCIRVFDSQGDAYKQAFQIFLDHTNQKRNAKRWLQRVVDDLPSRKVFIDAGAGNGQVTRAFAGAFDRTIADEFRAKHGDRYDVVTTLDPAHVTTPDLASAYAVAEFMLNLLDIDQPPTRQDVEAYVHSHFAVSGGGYRIPVDQDFLEIR